MRITLLGTGTSTGIPIIGCLCITCTSKDPRDKRLRCACHVEAGGLSIVIDTGPDFRQQMLQTGIRKVDAVLWTHHHFDHIVGLDDLRPYFFGLGTPMPCFAHPESAREVQRMFQYVFDPDSDYAPAPKLELHAQATPFTVRSRYGAPDALNVIPIEVEHGGMFVNGYRLGGFAYLTDVNRVPKTAFGQLENLDVLVLGALRHEPHPRHFTIRQAIEVSRRIGARKTVFIHLTHSILHARDDAELPEGFFLGFDGMELKASCS